MRIVLGAAFLLLLGGPGSATTHNPAPNVYEVTAGVEFTVGSSGASDFLFSWADDSGFYVTLPDPTLVLRVGETYGFRRGSSKHPLAITDATLPVTGSDGSYERTTSDAADIDAATLDPVADFTADPAPTTDTIVWTPGAEGVGTYFYTCTVPFHTRMTGRIEVSPDGTVPVAATSWSAVKALYRP